MWAPAPRDPHTFMGDDDSLLFRADEDSQSGSSFPESGTSLQSVVSHHVTHATHAAIGKEDSGGISHCEHNLSSRLSSLRALCVPAPRDTHKIPQRREFKLRRPHQATRRRRRTNASPRRLLSPSIMMIRVWRRRVRTNLSSLVLPLHILSVSKPHGMPKTRRRSSLEYETSSRLSRKKSEGVLSLSCP